MSQISIRGGSAFTFSVEDFEGSNYVRPLGRFIYNVHIVLQMLCVKDSMVLIHLADSNLLECSCDYFGNVIIPPTVYAEIKSGETNHQGEVEKIEKIIEKKKIAVKAVRRKNLIDKAHQFNIFRGEAEAVALYWQEKASWLATDDDNVRRKKEVLNLNLVGTPAIMLRLIRDRRITKEVYLKAVKILKKNGWFSNTVYDVLFLEVN